jgi:ubiquinone/menaquinone biosynthesis C-methylase UbiE
VPLFAPSLAQENSHYDQNIFHRLVNLESKSFWFTARNRLIVWALSRFFPGARHVLEIGVGTGFVLKGIRAACPDLALAGSDLHVTGLRYAAERLGDSVQLLQMDAQRIPFHEEFDVICLFDVLEHIQDDELVLRQLHRTVKPGGGLIITVPQHMFLWGPADEAARHSRRYGVRELEGKLTSAGFQVLLQTSFVSLLLPFMIISRYKSRLMKRYDLASELKLISPLNAAFSGLMWLEYELIRAGVRLPAGGSKLVVAVRR